MKALNMVRRISRRVLLILILLLLTGSKITAIGVININEGYLADLNENKLCDDLEIILSREEEPYPVIIHTEKKLDLWALEELEKSIGNFTLAYLYNYIDAFAAFLTKEQILHLVNEDWVKKIQFDAPVEIYMETASELINELPITVYNLDGDRDNNPTFFTPHDVVVAMIDTGIDVGHVDLPPEKVLGWVDLINGKDSPYDDNGHGTHVAGIVAGLGRGNNSFKGVAPGAGLVGIKALDSTGKSRMSFLDAGIEWVMNNQNSLGIDILNISCGTRSISDGKDSTGLLVNMAVEKGISVVVASGNMGPQITTIGSPAAAEKAITVSAMADCGEGGDFLAYFSSRGPTLDGRQKPDLCGPGWRIKAPQAKTKDLYTVFSGTSMAAPFTAGVIALMLDIKPTLNPEKIKEVLQKTAEDWGIEGWDLDYGYGKIAPGSAIALLAEQGYIVTKDQNHVTVNEDLPGTGFFDRWIIEISDLNLPLAITMVTYSAEPEANLNFYLFDPMGNIIARSENIKRQEWVSVQPRLAGAYTLEVVSYEGSGEYFIDLTGGILTYYLREDNRY